MARRQAWISVVVLMLLIMQLYADRVKVVPYPKQVTTGSGTVTIDPCSIVVSYSGDAVPALAEIMTTHRETILRYKPACQPHIANLYPIQVVQTTASNAAASGSLRCANETYQVLITEQATTLKVSCPVGLVRALATLWQLMRIEERVTPGRAGHLTERIVFEGLPIAIEDSPRFEHRGLMIDTARHFLQVGTIKQILNGMMQAKLNVLHWHLADDDSFSMQSRRIPGLAENASFGPGLFYSISDIQELVLYAQQRGVRIVPEIDCPGHSRAIGLFEPLQKIVACFNSVWPYTYKMAQIFRVHGGPPMGPLDPTMDETYDYGMNILEDLMEYFPDGLIHLGGDEVLKSCWDQRPAIKEFMKAHNISNYTELTQYYMNRLRDIMSSLNPEKKAVYWSNPDTFNIKYREEDVLQYWGSMNYIQNLTQLYPRNKFILSPTNVLYLSHGVGNWYGDTYSSNNIHTWLDIYQFEPANYSLPEAQILGAEAFIWDPTLVFLHRLFS